MIRILLLTQGLYTQYIPNPTKLLYDRLMKNYRVDFVQTDSTCNRTEWESSPKDVPSVPRSVEKSAFLHEE